MPLFIGLKFHYFQGHIFLFGVRGGGCPDPSLSYALRIYSFDHSSGSLTPRKGLLMATAVARIQHKNSNTKAKKKMRQFVGVAVVKRIQHQFQCGGGGDVSVHRWRVLANGANPYSKSYQIPRVPR